MSTLGHDTAFPTHMTARCAKNRQRFSTPEGSLDRKAVGAAHYLSLDLAFWSKLIEPHANFKAIWAPYLRYLERPNTGQNQIYPGSAIGGLYFTSDIHGPCLRSSPKVTLDMEIDAAGVKILLVELSTLLIWISTSTTYKACGWGLCFWFSSCLFAVEK